MSVTHIPIYNARATWTRSEGARISSLLEAGALYAHSRVRLRISGTFNIGVDGPPTEPTFGNWTSTPEIVRHATKVLNQLLVSVRRTTGRSDIPEIVPLHFNKYSAIQVDSQNHIVRSLPLVSLEYSRMSAGPPTLSEELSNEILLVSELPMHLELLESAKHHILAANARRAVLDLAGAFEALIGMYISPKVQNLAETAKEKFLRLYSASIPPETLQTIYRASVAPETDPMVEPSIWRILAAYQKQGLEPILPRDVVKAVQAPMKYRNDAAHGRAVPEEAMELVHNAIDAMEELHKLLTIEKTL